MESMPWIVLMSLLQMLLLDCLYFFSSNELIFMLCNLSTGIWWYFPLFNYQAQLGFPGGSVGAGHPLLKRSSHNCKWFWKLPALKLATASFDQVSPVMHIVLADSFISKRLFLQIFKEITCQKMVIALQPMWVWEHECMGRSFCFLALILLRHFVE